MFLIEYSQKKQIRKESIFEFKVYVMNYITKVYLYFHLEKLIHILLTY